jgi:hypothetical protein
MQSPQTQCKIPAENWQRTCGKQIITNAYLETFRDILPFPKRVSAATNRKLFNQGAAVCAPHGAIGINHVKSC